VLPWQQKAMTGMTKPARSNRAHSNSRESALEVGPASPTEQSAALEIVFSNLPPQVRAKTRQALLSAAERNEISFAGLLVARRGGHLRGAAWTQAASGPMASVWPPRVVEGEPEQTSRRLLRAVEDLLRCKPVRVAQALVQTDDRAGAESLQLAEYHWSTDLVCLVCPCSQFPTQLPDSELEFEPFSSDQSARMAEVVEQTFISTCDFRELSGVCKASEMLLGYRKVGAYRPESWFFVRRGGEDIGCLVLADQPSDNQCELLYMGVAPQVRGRSFGVEITRRALWETAQTGRRQLTLGVDAANQPALHVYLQLGFIEWDRRRVFLKFMPT
jgi:ribosomal protein S18 acetylase RimI-like enzyme